MSGDGAAEVESPDREAFRLEVRSFLEAHAEPRADVDPWVVSGFPDDAEAEAHFAKGRAWQATLADHGWAGITWPIEYGGRGGDGWMGQIFAAESARYGSHAGFVSATISMLGPTLLAWGTESQKKRFIPPLLRADEVWCQLFSEPGAGSDLAGLGTRAVLDGDDFVVDGQKVWSSCAQFCNWGFLLARTDPNAPKHRGISFFLLDMSSPGVEVRPLVQANGSTHFNEVFLTGVRIPANQLVGDLHAGWGPARMVLTNEAAFIGRGGGSTSERLVELAQMFGRQSDPVIRQGLATAVIRERIIRLLGRRIREAWRSEGASVIDPALAKVFAAESKSHSGELASAIAGPAGVVNLDQVSRWVQAEVINRFTISIGGGTTEVQKNNLAERSLGLPREPQSDRDTPWRDVPKS
ncbi:MAG: acyl-CoA dehydrogenase family protein [Actinomycetota bacterium]|nr:acyl-CoA dehydrogenase family protein [Actinomycetota bacterium]